MTTPDPVSAAQFAVIRQRFTDLGDKLTDAQLLELADAYHEMLRWRRQVRCRHPFTCSLSGRVSGEKRSFEDEDAEAMHPGRVI